MDGSDYSLHGPRLVPRGLGLSFTLFFLFFLIKKHLGFNFFSLFKCFLRLLVLHQIFVNCWLASTEGVGKVKKYDQNSTFWCFLGIFPKKIWVTIIIFYFSNSPRSVESIIDNNFDAKLTSTIFFVKNILGGVED